VNAVYGLHAGLKRVIDEGLDAVHERHLAAHARLVDGLANLGLEMTVAEADRLPQLNVVTIPEGVNDASFRSFLLDNDGLEIGAGLGAFAGKVWRIGLMGENARPERVDLVLNAIEAALTRKNSAA
jgi:alanine-glyoxylate transaminase/serine-glyoxylate transaminase/serine-pyruvate transaminase